jgi:hypothetical protein
MQSDPQLSFWQLVPMSTVNWQLWFLSFPSQAIPIFFNYEGKFNII